ncbi:MAG: DUF2029 domain-containing protein, partial [Anaerolineae bacterium]|nr:DUF2029 domain-containing protein [Anaerolineae bacterium]
MTNLLANRSVKQTDNHPLVVWIILGGLIVFLIAIESFALYTVFTSKFPSGNDFFVRWLGGREYLLHGTNPYDQSVAEQAQRAMFGRLTTPEDKDEAYFAYPLYTLYFFWPLSLLPYAWAQAIWMTLLQFMLLGVTVLSIKLADWSPPKWLFWVTLFWGVFFYNGARAIILGQFSVLVGLALLLGLWAIETRRDILAGICLSVTTIKPQMVVLVIMFIMIWAVFQFRWRIIVSFGLSMLTLLLSSMLLVPSWPLDFIRNTIAYSDYVAFGTPLENLLHFLMPPSLAAPLTVILSLLFLLMVLPGWWMAFRGRPGAYTWAIMTTIIVGSLVAFRSATTNQVILYLPLFFFFQRLTGLQAGLKAALTEGALMVI